MIALLLAALTVDQAAAAVAKRAVFLDAALSRDGNKAAWALSTATPDGPASDRSSIQVAPHSRVSACKRPGACEEHDLDWSPDGKQLAFLSDAGKRHQLDLYVWDGARVRRLTFLKGTLSNPRWSPDGRQLAVLFIEGEDAQGPTGPTSRDSGVVQETIHEQRLLLIEDTNRNAVPKPRPVSPADLFVYEYDWAPDGKSFAAVAAHGSGDDHWWVAQLYRIEAGEARLLYQPRTQLATPRFSPDGRSIAFIEGLMSDAGLTAGEIQLIPAAGGSPRNLTPGRTSSPSHLAWTGPDRLVFSEWIDGDSALAALTPSSGAVQPLWRAEEKLGLTGGALGFALSADGSRSLVARQSVVRGQELYQGTIAAWTQLTHANDELQVFSGPPVNIHWKSDSYDEQGFLIPPATVEAGRKYPLVVYVHGGPSWAAPSRFDRLWQLLSSQGYYVFAPNPRGSFGQGEAFTTGNVRDFGKGDLRDILAGLDAALKQGPIDPARVYLFGWSYGGFIGMWAATQTDRFKAIVAGAGIANWQSYYGTNRIDQWLLPFFGKSVYDDPAVYAACSPINFIKQAKTPTLLLHGERDAEVPASQSYEFWHALRTLGVETQLVIYPDEGHVPRQPKNSRDLDHRIAGWFDQHR